MESALKTPVLLLLFNRPEHTLVVLNRLRLLRPTQLYVHCDGPRPNKPLEIQQVKAVRDCIKTIDWPCEINTLYRDENAGLRDGVSSALNWFFNAVEAGIVLEDDCLPDPSFFPFCTELLEKYAKHDAVMHIGGSNLGAHLSQNMQESYFFSKLTFVWGWASWRRAWQKMSLNLEHFETFSDSNEIAVLSKNPMVQAYFMEKLRATKARENNSWAYAWSYSLLKSNGLSIVPSVNLVQNTGIGASEATHTTHDDQRARLSASKMTFPLIHPETFSRPEGLDTKLFFAAQKTSVRLFFWFVLHKLGLR
ncbi:MAG: hypothetical protein JNN28_10785 [Saprospiraceae bacterium]|nr:hypothetical protein [Saprospiraceae bacterium]